jgi:hypothetical protein
MQICRFGRSWKGADWIFSFLSFAPLQSLQSMRKPAFTIVFLIFFLPYILHLAVGRAPLSVSNGTELILSLMYLQEGAFKKADSPLTARSLLVTLCSRRQPGQYASCTYHCFVHLREIKPVHPVSSTGFLMHNPTKYSDTET